jgi:hypothetical protein
MWIEAYERIGNLAILTYGAYNAFGLIGPEKGGVAVVREEPGKDVLATKDFPYSPPARAKEFRELFTALTRQTVLDWSPRGKLPTQIRLEVLKPILKERHYEVR